MIWINTKESNAKNGIFEFMMLPAPTKFPAFVGSVAFTSIFSGVVFIVSDVTTARKLKGKIEKLDK